MGRVICSLVVALGWLDASAAMAASTMRAAADVSAVRPAEPATATLIAAGLDHSQSFQDLVRRFGRTGWIVFVMHGHCPTTNIAACLLHTVGTYQGRRYLRIVVDDRRLRPLPIEIGTIAHELQHAVEVAEAGDVTDAASVAALFRRIGRVSIESPTATAYETDAALRAGERVRREMFSALRQ